MKNSRFYLLQRVAEHEGCEIEDYLSFHFEFNTKSPLPFMNTKTQDFKEGAPFLYLCGSFEVKHEKV